MSEYYDQHESARSGGVWATLNSLVIMLIVLSLAVPLSYAFLPEFRRERDQLERIAVLKSTLEREVMLLARYTREEKLLTDPAYVALLARDHLDVMREGETIYRFETPKVTGGGTPPELKSSK